MDFRNYDPTIGRFHNPDLLAEISPDWSPYRFAFNNPVAFNDPTGLREGDDGGPGDIEVNVFFDEESKHVEFDFLGAHWKINVPEGGADPEGDGTNYASEDNAEFADYGNMADGGYENESAECGPCVLIPLLVGGIAMAPSPNIETNLLARDQAVDLGQTALSFAIPSPNIAIGISYKFSKVSFNSLKLVNKTKKVLPSIDATGKVHGTLPKVSDFGKYSKEELRILLKELQQSVQKRIEVTSKMGRDRGHGQRQGAEQDLIKSLEKYLGQ